MTMWMTSEERQQIRAKDEAQAAQELRHAASPYTEPKYLSADHTDHPSEAWTAGWQQED